MIYHIYTIYVHIWGIFTSGNTRFNHIGKLVSKSLFDLPLKKMGPLWVHNREREKEREGDRERGELYLKLRNWKCKIENIIYIFDNKTGAQCCRIDYYNEL